MSDVSKQALRDSLAKEFSLFFSQSMVDTLLAIFDVYDSQTSTSIGDMFLGVDQVVTELKTYLNNKLAIKGTDIGKIILSTSNSSVNNFTAVFPAKDIEVADNKDIPDITTKADIENPIFKGVVTSPAFSGRRNPRIQSLISNANIIPNADKDDVVDITKLATNTMFSIPSGTPVNKQVLMVDIMPDSTPRNLKFDLSNGGYASGGVTLPTVTKPSKMMSMLFIYDSAAVKWKLRSLAQEV